MLCFPHPRHAVQTVCHRNALWRVGIESLEIRPVEPLRNCESGDMYRACKAPALTG
ncbi:hypothetical protein BH09VER1_BH09VER1_55210 [soil metagenome]